MKVVRGNLVLLPYPFSNLSGVKVRPALIVSGNKFNSKSKDIVMVPLTSVIRDGNFSVVIKDENLSSGKLIRKSEIRCDKIFCASRGLVKKVIGKLEEKIFNEVIREIGKIFD